MSEKKPGRLSKAAGKVGGIGKAAIKKKAAGAIASAAKPVTDAVAEKVAEVGRKAMAAVEKKATEIVKDQIKKETKKKFFGR